MKSAGKKKNPVPFLLYSNAAGEIFEHPALRMAVRSGASFHLPDTGSLVELPEGSDLFTLPGRAPVGFEGAESVPLNTRDDEGKPFQAVAAFLAPSYTQTGLAAYLKRDDAVTLPLYAYTAVGWRDDRFWAAGLRIDPDRRQDLRLFSQKKIEEGIREMTSLFPRNRLVQQLERCALEYRCPAAKNFFLRRWECPVPTSPTCNAECVGCISLQPSGICPSSQKRIDFVPTPEEIAEPVVFHLENAPRPVASFGQGCEGEPLLQGDVIEASIKLIRHKTSRGVLNLNTNGSLPDVVKRLLEAGLDSVRITLNSARKSFYDLYFRPAGYSLDAVIETLSLAKRESGFTSLNYLVFPGFTDQVEEKGALFRLIEKTGLDMIQWRNLNIDPDLYWDSLRKPEGERVGIKPLLRETRKKFPSLRHGYFNPFEI